MAETLPVARHETRKDPGSSPEILQVRSPESREQLSPEKESSSQELAAEAREAIASTAVKAEQSRERLEASGAPAQTLQRHDVNQELKAITLRRELKQIRRKLSPPERVLSKLVHQPVVRVVSEAASKTISRPSGLLGGGLVAFLGTSSYLYLAKHFGFTYNYLIFLGLFFGGFIIGLVLELVVHAATASRRHSDS